MTHERPTSEEELVERVRSIDIEAPPALRRRVEQMIADAPARGRLPLRGRRARGGPRASAAWRSRPLAGALAAAAVVAVLAVALSSGGGSRHTLGLTSAAAPTLLASTTPAPLHSAHSRFLTTGVEGVRFPYLEDALRWRSTGARTDTVDGRAVTTVFYSRGRARVGYAIYAGVPSPSSGGGVVRWDHGTQYHVLAGNGTAIIAWKRDGHLCVMSSSNASAAELIHLAGWTGARASAA